MNRIRFRAWSKSDNCFTTDVYVGCYGGLVTISDCPSCNMHYVFDVEEDDIIIDESTGQKDRNGEEVFERDLVSISVGPSLYTREVFCAEDGTWCVKLPVLNSTDSLGEDFAIFGIDYQIIGNVHQNKVEV